MIRSHKKSIYEILGRDPVHPFPARMAPGIALEALAGARRPLRVLDPMMGSGTVLAVARSKGHRAIGIDIDPLAVLIAKVWTATIDTEVVRSKATEVLERARRIFCTLSSRDAYPRHADSETRRFVAYWFDSYARRQLASLASAISHVRDDATRDALWCGFSRLIIAKQAGASLAMDLSHSRPHKIFRLAPEKPFRKFLAAVERVVNNCIAKGAIRGGPPTCTRQGDARNLPLADGSVDLVLTSPPYLNALDYMRCSKFSLVWMGRTIAELRQLRADSVGTEVGKYDAEDDDEITDIVAQLRLAPTIPLRERAMLIRYIDDMRSAIQEASRVLVPGGAAVYVIGENTVHGTYVRNSAIISALAASAGLKFGERRIRTLPANRRYLPPPSTLKSETLDARMRREVVTVFIKPSRTV